MNNASLNGRPVKVLCVLSLGMVLAVSQAAAGNSGGGGSSSGGASGGGAGHGGATASGPGAAPAAGAGAAHAENHATGAAAGMSTVSPPTGAGMAGHESHVPVAPGAVVPGGAGPSVDVAPSTSVSGASVSTPTRPVNPNAGTRIIGDGKNVPYAGRPNSVTVPGAAPESVVGGNATGAAPNGVNQNGTVYPSANFNNQNAPGVIGMTNNVPAPVTPAP